MALGPIADDEHVAGQWHATGTYAGGMPAIIVPEGSPVSFTGTDTLRGTGCDRVPAPDG